MPAPTFDSARRRRSATFLGIGAQAGDRGLSWLSGRLMTSQPHDRFKSSEVPGFQVATVEGFQWERAGTGGGHTTRSMPLRPQLGASSPVP